MSVVVERLPISAKRNVGWSYQRLLSRATLYAVLLAGAVIFLLPFAYMVGISFTPNTYVLQMPPSFIPAAPSFQNYVAAWNQNSFGTAFSNSVIVSVTATILGGVLAAALAFAFGRYRFPGRTILFYALLSTLLVPSIVLIIPQFVLASHLHLTNSRLGLILAYAATNGTAFSVFLLRNFFAELPQELFDAAALDRCGVFGSFVRIGLPLARPALSAVIIFSFLGNWDEFTLALTFLNQQTLYTLPVAIQQFQSVNGTQWGIVFAGTTLAVLPVILVFLIFQRQFVQGISVGAVKG